jgi:hypothetical protein
MEVATAEVVAQLLASPLTPADLAALEAAEAAIRRAGLEDLASQVRQGEALSRLRCLQAHHGERDRRGRPIPTEAGRWGAYLRRRFPGLAAREADRLADLFRRDLERRHHATAEAP